MIGILWHLHQPEYRHPATHVPVMPWTRLHALRGYRDLLVESVESGVPWTVNIVPGLWEQVLYYAEGGSDGHLELTRIPADGLTAEQVAVIQRTFPCGNPVMRQTPRYRQLEDRILAGRLSVSEIRDLQVLSTLVWFGATARRDFPVLDELCRKGRGFTEADKTALLGVQAKILASFPQLLQAFVATDGPALSTSPYHHPILPLLIDLSHSRRCLDATPDVEFAYPQDAVEQLMRGRSAMRDWTGRAPRGCWPSEGSVSPETIACVAEAGFSWMATDDGVLERSKRVRHRHGPGGWDLGEGVRGFFRDHATSDRIGFDYARMTVAASMRDLRQRTAGPGLHVLALDGENPWEAFADAGSAFRSALIAHLLDTGITLDAACELEPVGRVEHLHTGSWIGADFAIWAGSAEDHTAWALLAAARRAVEEASTGQEAAMEHLLAAEGSDWFWWYGPEFDTPFAAVFDAAFRGHLAAAYAAIGQTAPPELDRPVAKPHSVEAPLRALPADRTSPSAWLGAGVWPLAQGSMARSHGHRVRFGWDPDGVLHLELPADVVATVDGVGVKGPVVAVRAPFGSLLQVDDQRVPLPGPDWGV